MIIIVWVSTERGKATKRSDLVSYLRSDVPDDFDLPEPGSFEVAGVHGVDLIESLAKVIDSEDRGLLDRLAAWDRWEELRERVDGRRPPR